MSESPSVTEASIAPSLAKSIRCIFSDVDGVLTDGTITYDSNGVESKAFHVRDGVAIKRWMAAGNDFVIVTARGSDMVQRRADELGIKRVIQNCRDKSAACHEILGTLGIDWSQSAYIGDDLADWKPMSESRIGFAPSDACRDILQVAALRLSTRGGQGAVREAIENLMRSADTWPAPMAALSAINHSSDRNVESAAPRTGKDLS